MTADLVDEATVTVVLVPSEPSRTLVMMWNVAEAFVRFVNDSVVVIVCAVSDSAMNATTRSPDAADALKLTVIVVLAAFDVSVRERIVGKAIR